VWCLAGFAPEDTPERRRIGVADSSRDLIDEAGQPTIMARDEILSFFAERLRFRNACRLARDASR
jgi:hypothetical protein